MICNQYQKHESSDMINLVIHDVSLMNALQFLGVVTLNHPFLPPRFSDTEYNDDSRNTTICPILTKTTCVIEQIHNQDGQKQGSNDDMAIYLFGKPCSDVFHQPILVVIQFVTFHNPHNLQVINLDGFYSVSQALGFRESLLIQCEMMMPVINVTMAITAAAAVATKFCCFIIVLCLKLRITLMSLTSFCVVG